MIKKLALVCIITAGTMITATPLSFFSSLKDQTYATAGKACSLLFGKEDASPELIALAQETRAAYGLPAAPAPVKYQAPIGGWTLPFSSFTWFGTTWVDKQSWEKMTPVQKEYEMTHEIGHEYLNHSVKQIGVAGASGAGLLLLNAYGINPLMQKAAAYGMTTLANKAIILTVQAATLLAGLKKIVPAYVRYCEKSADQAAAYNLLKNDKISILKNYVKELEEQGVQNSNKSSVWFADLDEQIKNIEAVMKEKNEENI